MSKYLDGLFNERSNAWHKVENYKYNTPPEKFDEEVLERLKLDLEFAEKAWDDAYNSREV